jgi:hypothetical protein
MPADFSNYIDLKIFDISPGDIYLASLDVASLTIPEFNLRVGTPEDAIFQAMAYISALNIAAINRLPDRLMAAVLLMMGVVRQEGIPAEVELTISADSYEGATVPAGTAFVYRTTFEDEAQDFVFQTVDTLSIPVDVAEVGPFPSGTVYAQCTSPGAIPVIGEDTELQLISSGVQILSAVSGNSFTNGVNADTDADYLSRAATYLASLSRTLNKASQVDAYVLTNYTGVVGRAKTYDLTYGDSTFGDIGTYREDSPTGLSRTSDTVTLTFPSAHQFLADEKVLISSLAPTYAAEDTLYTVTSTTDTTISYSKAGASVAFFDISASVGSVTIGEDEAGYVTLFVYGLNEPVSNADKTVIKADLVGRCSAGLTINVNDISLVTLEISGDVVLDAAYDQSPLQDAVYSALVDYLSPMTFPLTDSTIRNTSLISIISRIPGVLYVDSLTLTGTGSGWLPKIGNDLQFRDKGTLPSLSSADIDITFTSLEL